MSYHEPEYVTLKARHGRDAHLGLRMRPLGGLGQADGLGQTGGSALVSIPPRSADLTAIQQRLVADGLLSITPDGVISSASSPTLTAVRAWATSHGLSATGVARIGTGGTASVGGLALRRDLADALLGGATTGTSSAVPVAPSGGGTPSGGGGPAAGSSKSGGATASGGKSGGAATSLLPDVPAISSDTSWLPWAIGGGIALLVLGGGAIAMSR